jgi:hypothetical protein
MNWIALNVPLAVAMLGFAAGLPLWVMFKHPETDRPVALDLSVLRVASAGAEGAAADATSPFAPAGTDSRVVYV